jgi:hypothetical protein
MMTHDDVSKILLHKGYDLMNVLAIDEPYVVWQDGIGNVRVKDLRRPFEGLLGAFYHNHNGNGETAVEAALAAIGKAKQGRELTKEEAETDRTWEN